ncbi:MAG: hypothetical protein KIT27_07320, partial [Legionellales bacterium]|nr:hypothetical protein [Legionellales bacterium]
MTRFYFLLTCLKYFCFILILFYLLNISRSFAWSNPFTFINNFNFPVSLTLTNTTLNWSDPAGIHNSCGNSISNITIPPQQKSCEFTLTDGHKTILSQPGNQGTITLAQKNDP